MARKDEYKATEYPGIKQRISDGKYLAIIDLGRQPKLDKKTGLIVEKQCKTQKLFDTLKEAKAYQGENNKATRNGVHNVPRNLVVPLEHFFRRAY